jgi:hypothetical protein
MARLGDQVGQVTDDGCPVLVYADLRSMAAPLIIV